LFFTSKQTGTKKVEKRGASGYRWAVIIINMSLRLLPIFKHFYWGCKFSCEL